MSTELTIVERAAVALNSSSAEAHLTALARGTQHIVEVTNKAGREECHSAAMTALKARTAVITAGLDARADATAFGKAVIAEEARLVAIIEPEERRLKALRDAWDNEQKRIKDEAKRVELERVEGIMARIQSIRDRPSYAAMATLDECRSMHNDLFYGIQIDDSFCEFQERASIARQNALAAVSSIIAAKEADAEAAAKAERDRIAAAAVLAAEREEFARIKSAADEQRRIERAAEKAAKAESDRIAAEERAALAAEKKKFDDERASILAGIEAERKRVRDAEALAAAIKADQEAKIAAHQAAEKRAADEAANKALALITDRLQRINAECETMEFWQLDEVLAAIAGLTEKWKN